jgi:hypothetical protein
VRRLTSISSICLALAGAGGSHLAATAERQSDVPAIEMLPATPTMETEELMRLWHHRYRGRISPVLHEWQRVLETSRGQGPVIGLTAGCRRLGSALDRLDHGRIPAAPDPSVSVHLEKTLRSLAEAARSCSHGAYFLTTWRLEQAEDSWRELRGRLLLYGLSP